MRKNHRVTTRQPFAVDVPWLLGFSAESWIASQFSETSVPPYSCKTTVNNDLLTLISPLGSVDILDGRNDASGGRCCRPGRAARLGGSGWSGCVRVRARRACV